MDLAKTAVKQMGLNFPLLSSGFFRIYYNCLEWSVSNLIRDHDQNESTDDQ